MGQYTQAVQQLYVAYFNRPADPVGLAYWEARLLDANGAASVLAEISNAFSVSAEYTSVYAGKNEVSVVDQVYQNLFGRHAEHVGLMYWANLLASKKVTVANIVAKVAGGALSTDLAAYNAKVSAASSFTNGLTTEEQIKNYAGDTALVLAKNYIASVTDAASLASAINASALAATIAAVLAAGDVLNNVSKTFILTTGIDTFTGGTGNDSFVANATTVQTLTSSDKLDGGAGNNDLKVVSTTGATANIAATAELKNIQTASLSADSAMNVDTTKWADLSKLSVSSKGETHITTASTTNVTVNVEQKLGQIEVQGGNNVTITSTSAQGAAINVGTKISPVGDVLIARANNDTSGGNGGTINVTGGKTIAITTVSGNPVTTTETHGTVTVVGSSVTTSVSVLQSASVTASANKAGVAAGAVSITDVNAGAASLVAGTITSATVDSYTTLSISDNALKTLSLANGSSNVTIDNSSSLASVSNKTLALSVNALTGGVLDDADIYTTLNITTVGANSSLANISFGAVTTMSVAGSKDLSLISTAGLSKLSTVSVSGSASISADLSAATVTAVDTSATTGAAKVSINASKATYTGGAGADTVTNSAATSSKAISLGAGDDSLTMSIVAANPTAKIDAGTGIDTLSMTATLAESASKSTEFASVVTGFENLTLSSAGKQTIDLAVLGKFNNVSLSGGTELTVKNMPSAGSLELRGAGTGYTIVGDAEAVSGKNDVLNLKLTDGLSEAVSYASAGISAEAFETVLITTSDTQTTPNPIIKDSVKLSGNTVSNITVAGNAGLTLNADSTALSNVDASGISLGGFVWKSGALTAGASVKGSATGGNEIDLSSATVGAMTYIGGKGVDVVTVAGGKHVLTLGDGADVVSITAPGANLNTYSTITDAPKGVAITFANKEGTEEFNRIKVSLASNATFQNYADAVVAAAGDASTNAKGGWFQFNGDTYYVQSQHNGTTLVSFHDGTDFVVKLTGLVDLSSAAFNNATNTLTIA